MYFFKDKHIIETLSDRLGANQIHLMWEYALEIVFKIIVKAFTDVLRQDWLLKRSVGNATVLAPVLQRLGKLVIFSEALIELLLLDILLERCLPVWRISD